MDLQFFVTIVVGDNYDKRVFTIDYDATLKDLNDFANENGYSDIEIMLKKEWNDDDSIDILNDYIDALHKGKYYMVEGALLDIGYIKDIEKFLSQKYQSQFEGQLVYKLTINDDDFKFEENENVF